MGKRYEAAAKLVDPKKRYRLAEAVEILKKFPKTKFDESIDLAVKLGVDPKHSDQMVRGTVSLPHGTGKKVRILVFAEGEPATAARNAGADFVGYKELIEKVKGGWFDFDLVIATPAAMSEVRKLGRELGPKGLMPNPKTGTVAEDTAKAVKEFQAGRVEFKLDKAGNLHISIAKASFEANQIAENARATLDAIVRARPAAAKGTYLENAAISATMSPAVKLDVKEFVAA
ncbi:MAG: 50S ribosomal protein L1 [Verrucomicrobiae bacterium]|nr:50S ribosomal protein L1 [Verrucomicrobiae bacterium]